MDRRQQKTRKAIFDAFAQLLEHNSFSQITVQEIIDSANVGRSTFYSHFETKESLLQQLCSDIFNHVFSDHLNSEKTHDFSGSDHDLQEQITHVLYHIRDNGAEMQRLLLGESGDLFMGYFKSYLPQMFESVISNSESHIPLSFMQSFLAGSFADAVLWWISNDMGIEPEKMARYYLSVIENGALK